jgi:DNA-binding MurR/RpiR family transcriptional regulator
VDLLSGARQLVAVGLHEAGAVVRHVAYVFELLGIPSLPVTDASESNLARLTGLGDEDVVLGVGFRKSHRFTVSYIAQATAAGVRTVVITDNSLSELAGKARVTLLADIDSTFFTHSLVGPLSLVGALAAACYARDRQAHDARLRLIREQATESAWLR